MLMQILSNSFSIGPCRSKRAEARSTTEQKSLLSNGISIDEFPDLPLTMEALKYFFFLYIC